MSEHHMEESANNESPSQKHNRFVSTFGLIEAGAVLVCLFTLVGFLGGWFWMFELTSHFRVQYAVLLGLAAILLAARRKWRAALVYTTFALINAFLLLPFVPKSEEQPAQDGQSIRLLVWNVNSQSTRDDELTRLIREHDPDLVMLMEVNPAWADALRGLTEFPNQLVVPREDNFGIAIVTRLDLVTSETLYLGEVGVPSIQTSVSLGKQKLLILSTHPLPPAGFQYSRLRDEQLNRIADWVDAQLGPVVVVGDLNTTPWSPVFAEFIKRTDLINSAEGRGIQGTWPGGFPIMRIPIDHFLHSTEIVVTRRETLDAIGSDHLPLLVEFTTR